MTTSDYLNEPVIYGGLEATRGAMLADLHATAATYTDDPTRQQMFVNRYMQGFERRA
jgi:hypothetical protein